MTKLKTEMTELNPDRRNRVEMAVKAMLYSCTGCALHISEGIIHIYVNRPRIRQYATCIATHSSPSNRDKARVFQAEGTTCANVWK